jgi:hypothetical protein
MFGRFWQAIRPAIFWSFRRGSWQYDLIVAGILAFIFLTPKSFFRDQPRTLSVQKIEVLAQGDALLFLVDPKALEGQQPAETTRVLRRLLKQETGRDLEILETRPSANAEGEVTGYLVYARP